MNQIAREILRQLGGERFAVMVGATTFVYGPNFLQFNIGRGAVDNIGKVRVVLTPADTYTMEFYKRGEEEAAGVVTDVCFNELEDVFTERTGLYTSL